MRDIRADLNERIEDATKARAKATELYICELIDLEAKHASVAQGYEAKIRQLEALLALECEQHDRVARNTKSSDAAIREDRTKDTSVDHFSLPIGSVDAARRLDALSNLVRGYQKNGQSKSQQSPDGRARRSRVA
jgi:hypothetical protein